MCAVCQENTALTAVTAMGRPVETKGYYVVAGRRLLAYDDKDQLQDRVLIRFCPECGDLLPAEEGGAYGVS